MHTSKTKWYIKLEGSETASMMFYIDIFKNHSYETKHDPFYQNSHWHLAVLLILHASSSSFESAVQTTAWPH